MRADSGVTFIEVLVSVVLLGTVVVAVLASLGVSIRGSVTHEEKVMALSVLESAASGLKIQADPCDESTYRDLARETVEDPGWAARLEVSAVDCSDTDLHEVTLSVTAPRGLTQVLEVAVGGPRVADTEGAGEFDDSTAPIISCAVTNIVANPNEAVLNDEGVLSEDVTLIVTTDNPGCTSALRANFDPDPINPVDGFEWQPALEGAGDTYSVVLVAGQYVWTVGTQDVMIVDDSNGATVGSRAGFLEINCVVEGATSNPSPPRQVDGRLDGDVGVTVTISPACPDPGSLTFTVDTGTEVYTDVLADDDDDGAWIGNIPGQEGVGPVFEPGPTTIEVVDAEGLPIALLPLEIQA